MMNARRTFEIFSAGCFLCDELVVEVSRNACPRCEVKVRNLGDPENRARAKELSVRAVPAVAVDGKLADCCRASGPDMKTLASLGLGAQS